MASWKKKSADVLTLVVGVSIFLFSIHWITRYFDITPIPRHVELPAVELPPERDPSLKKVELLQSPFFASDNPFSEAEYSLAPRIVLGGNFSSAVLSIQGEVIQDDAVFLLLNFNRIAGVIKGSRLKDNALDIDKTLEKGGLFTKNAPISVEVDLMNDVLGVSSTDLKSYPSGERPINLITENQLPEVYKVLVLPFVRSGKFGGAKIDSLSITYSCIDGDDDCLIEVCEKPKLTQCITEKFGTGATISWRKRNGI